MSIETMGEKFTHDLADIFDAEHQFLEAQNEMLAQATSETLRTMLMSHIAQTREQIDNIRLVYAMLGVTNMRVECKAAAGLVAEGQQLMRETADAPALRDCAIADAAAKVEHYEIASYRNLLKAAPEINAEIARLLRQNLEQEEETAHKIEESQPSLLNRALSIQRAAQFAS
jgi:ferritin-like metal-binding protein YciE